MSGSALYETFARVPLAFERGEGSWLITENGERYLDFAAGIAVNSLGHGHPHLVAGADRAGRQALARLQPLRDSRPEPAGRAAGRGHLRRQGVLHQFGRGGAGMRDQDGAPLPVCRRAIPSASASSPSRAPSTAARWRPSPPAARHKYLEGFGPKVEGFDQVPFDDIDAAEEADRPETAAILIEPVQGEGGIRPLPGRSR